MANSKILLLTLNPTGYSPIYFSSAAYTTLPTDTLANTQFKSRILNDPSFSRSVSTKIWGGGKSGISIGAFDIAIGDGKLESPLWLDPAAFTDSDAEIAMLFDTQSHNARFKAAICVVDRVEAVSSNVARVYLRDLGRKHFEKSALNSSYDDSVPSTRRASTLRPLALGGIFQARPFLSDPSLQLFDLNDNRKWEMLSHTNTMVFKTRGVLATLDTDYREAQDSNCIGVEYLVSILGADPFTADFGGSLLPVSTLIDDNFLSWTGGFGVGPDGWTYSSHHDVPMGGSYFTDAAPGCAIVSDGSMLHFEITHDTALLLEDTGYFYQLSYLCNNPGVLTVDMGILQQNFTLSVGTGYVYGYVFNDSGSPVTFGIRLNSPDADGLDVVVDNCLLQQVETTRSPANFCRYLAVNRGGFPSASFDDASFQTNFTCGEYGVMDTQVGAFITEASPIYEFLDKTADSFSGWWWIDRLGVCKAGRFVEPSTLSLAVAVSDTNIVKGTDVESVMDMAPGLSSMWNYDKNWYPLSDNDFAGSVSSDDRELMSAPYRIHGRITAPMSPAYAGALNAAPIDTLVSNMAAQGVGHGEASLEPDRVCGLYNTKARFFYNMDLVLEDSTYLTLEPGDGMAVNIGKLALTATTTPNVQVVQVDGFFISNRVKVRSWG